MCGRVVWLSKLRAYERLKFKAKRPDRVQECINALLEEGREQGWM